MSTEREPVDPVDPADLMGPQEVQHALGVSRQRVQQLVRHPDFPEPAATLAMGSVWSRPDIEAWAQRHGRTLN